MVASKGGVNSRVGILKVSCLHEFSKKLTGSRNVDEILNGLMETISNLLEPEAAAFLLREASTHDLKYSLVNGQVDESLKGKILLRGEGLPGLAAETNQDILIIDCSQDPRFNPEIEQVKHIEFKSVIAVPFRVANRVFGVFYLINRKDRQNYQIEDLNLLSSLIKQAEISIERLIYLKRIKELEEIDSITGVLNNRGFFKYFQKEIARAERYKLDLSMLEIRIDYYHKILQTFGQEAGERVIVNLSSILRKTSRKVDLVGHLEEDLFMVLLPHTDSFGAGRLRDRILKILNHQNLRQTGIPYTVTINIHHETGENTVNLYRVPIILNLLNNLNRKDRTSRSLLPGEELEENIKSSLFLNEK